MKLKLIMYTILLLLLANFVHGLNYEYNNFTTDPDLHVYGTDENTYFTYNGTTTRINFKTYRRSPTKTACFDLNFTIDGKQEWNWTVELERAGGGGGEYGVLCLTDKNYTSPTLGLGTIAKSNGTICRRGNYGAGGSGGTYGNGTAYTCTAPQPETTQNERFEFYHDGNGTLSIKIIDWGDGTEDVSETFTTGEWNGTDYSYICMADSINDSSFNYWKGYVHNMEFYYNPPITPTPFPNILQFDNNLSINFTSDGGQLCGWNSTSGADQEICGPSTDKTPTFKFTTDNSGVCRLDNESIDYSSMNSSMDCTTIGGTSHTCTYYDDLPLQTINPFYISCCDTTLVNCSNYTLDNATQLNYSLLYVDTNVSYGGDLTGAEFRVSNLTAQHLEPVGQNFTVPIYNVTNIGTADAINIYSRLNESLPSGIDFECSISPDYYCNFTLDTVNQYIGCNTSFIDTAEIGNITDRWDVQLQGDNIEVNYTTGTAHKGSKKITVSVIGINDSARLFHYFPEMLIEWTTFNSSMYYATSAQKRVNGIYLRNSSEEYTYFMGDNNSNQIVCCYNSTGYGCSPSGHPAGSNYANYSLLYNSSSDKVGIYVNDVLKRGDCTRSKVTSIELNNFAGESAGASFMYIDEVYMYSSSYNLSSGASQNVWCRLNLNNPTSGHFGDTYFQLDSE